MFATSSGPNTKSPSSIYLVRFFFVLFFCVCFYFFWRRNDVHCPEFKKKTQQTLEASVKMCRPDMCVDQSQVVHPKRRLECLLAKALLLAKLLLVIA